MDSIVRVALGLGNPGRRYEQTRHNLGFRVVDLLAGRLGGRWERSGPSHLCRVPCGPHPLLLVKPQTFMNDSGAALRPLLEHHDLELRNLLVIVDDVHLGPGALRVRRRGSDGGHNGLKSVIEAAASSDFARMRLGVGSPPAGADLIDYVLGDFKPDEEAVVAEQVTRAADGVVCWATSGLEAAMNQFNS